MSAVRHKSMSLRIKASAAPSAEHLALINELALSEMSAEQLYVRTFVVAHNAIDRDNEVFDDALLADFARTLPGKGLFLRHPSGWDGDSGPGEGRWFAAELQHMSLDEARTLLRAPGLQWPPTVTTATLLMASAYLARTESNKDLLVKLDAGIVSDVSIGFTGKSAGPITDAEGRELTARRITSPGEALEASLVWLGAQPGARAVKGAKTDPSEDTAMPTQAELDAALTKAATAEAELKSAQPAREIVLKARQALGDDGALIDNPALLAEAVTAGKAYRKALVDTIVAGERAQGTCADDPESVKAAEAIYAGFPLSALETRAKHYESLVPAGGLRGGNPNQPPPTDDPDGRKNAPAVFAGASLI